MTLLGFFCFVLFCFVFPLGSLFPQIYPPPLSVTKSHIFEQRKPTGLHATEIWSNVGCFFKNWDKELNEQKEEEKKNKLNFGGAQETCVIPVVTLIKIVLLVAVSL